MGNQTNTSELAIVCFPGYRQVDGPGNGMFRLYDQLAQRYHDRRRYLVLLRTWDSDAKATAELITHRRADQTIVIGYSYGCGWGIKQLAAELGKLKRGIDRAFLIDPVPRWRLPARWMALTRFGRYLVPPNIAIAHSWRQVNTRPYGRRPKAQGSHTSVHERAVFGSPRSLDRHADESIELHVRDLRISHGNIDEHEEIQKEILRIIAREHPLEYQTETAVDSSSGATCGPNH